MKAFKTLAFISIFSGLGITAHAFEGKRSTTINFEDEVIEGINRKPLDSVNQLSERNRKANQHLYHKRAGFSDRDLLLANELRLHQ